MRGSGRALWMSLFVVGAIAGFATGRRADPGIGIGGQVQHDRSVAPAIAAAEPGRGRWAGSPLAIPVKGWKDILARTYAEIGDDRLLALAAAVVFYGLLAIFPAVTALVSLYGLFASPATISDHVATLATFLPAGSFQIISDQIGRVVAKSDGKLTFAFVAGLALAVWSANAGIKAMLDALNVVYGEEEKRSYLTLNLVSLAFTLGAIVLALVAIGAVVVFPLMLDRLGLADRAALLVSLLRWPVILVVLIATLAVLYRFGPSRREALWQWVSVGSLFASLAWIAASAAFSFYLSNFGNYDAAYGSMGAAIGLMMWMWLTFIVILVGAELNSEVEHQTLRDTTTSGGMPIGLRGAVMADTVGKAS